MRAKGQCQRRVRTVFKPEWSSLVLLGIALAIMFSPLCHGDVIISSDETWPFALSPFVVPEKVLIESGVTLTIEPGVEVRFYPGTYIKVEGYLYAQGTQANPIVFTSDSGTPSAGDWAGIRIRETGGTTHDGSGNYVSGSLLEHVRIEYASTGLYIYNTSLIVDSSEFSNNSTAIELCKTNGVIVRDSSFLDNGTAFYSIYESYSGDGYGDLIDTTIERNRFWSNSVGIGLNLNQRNMENLYIADNDFWSNGTAICIGGGGYGPRAHSIFVLGNRIWNNGGAIAFPRFYGPAGGAPTYQVMVQQNLIWNNSGSPYSMDGWNGSGVKYWIEGNVVGRNGGGIGLSSSNGSYFSGNSVFDNGGGISIGGSNWQLSDNTLSDTNAQLLSVSGSTHTITSNNFFRNNASLMGVSGAEDYTVTGNYWGTTDVPLIASMIHDYYDDFELGEVTFEPILTSPNLWAPVSVVSGLEVLISGSQLDLSWNANPESDVVGYWVFYDTDGDYPFDGTGANEGASGIDVGNVTSYSLTGLDLGQTWYVTVTAYDADADGTDDYTDGYESWFALPFRVSQDPGTIVSVSPNSALRGETLDVEIEGAGTSFYLNSSVDFGPGTVVSEVLWQDYEHLTANLTISWEAVPEAKDVLVSTGSMLAVGEGLFFVLSDGYVPAPTGLTATAGGTSILLHWNPTDGYYVVGYNVYRDTSETGAFTTKLNSSVVSITSFDDTTATPGVTYWYKVSAVTADPLESEKSAPASATAAQVVVSMADVRGMPGDSVRVQVSIPNARNISATGMEVHIAYDASILTPTAIETTPVTAGLTFDDNLATASGLLDIVSTSTGDLIGEGHMLDVLFDISPSAILDTTSSLSFTDVIMFNTDSIEMSVDYSGTATLTITPEYSLGDVDGDGVLTMDDARLLHRFVKGELEPNILQQIAGDINGDGELDMSDFVLLVHLIHGNPINPGNAGAKAFGVEKGATISSTVQVTPTSAEQGETVQVPITIDDAQDAAGFDLTVTFDPAALQVVDVVPGSVTNGFELSWHLAGGALYIAIGSSEETVCSGAGTLCVVEFYVRRQALPGDTGLTLASLKLSGTHGEDLSWERAVYGLGAIFSINAATQPPSVSLRDQYNALDGNGDGLSLDEARLGVPELSLQEFDSLDTDNNGRISMEELLADSVGPVGVQGEVWVQFSYSGDEMGTQQEPFDTVAEATAFVRTDGTGLIRIKAGSSSETARITVPVRIQAEGGLVRLGGT